MFLVDDEYVEETEEASAPTQKQRNDLKKHIKTIVRQSGGKLDIGAAIRSAHEQFLSEFSWGEIEAACSELQGEWETKRAQKNVLKPKEEVI
jgi:hypothetical protein